MQLTAVYRKVAEGYIGFVEELPGANVQGATLEEMRANLVEAVELVRSIRPFGDLPCKAMSTSRSS